MVSIFPFGWKWRLKRLRKRWDRLREKALGKPEPLRSQLLQKLDVVENKLRTLEEQQLNLAMRARLAKEVELDLEEIKAVIKQK